MDIAVNLVEHYLRLNGYLTLSEFEIQQRSRHGRWETATDVDIVAVRFPGDVLVSDVHNERESRLLTIHDAALQLEDGTVDVLIGEVKQGDAVFNASLTSHPVLHTVLRRFAWLYGEDLGVVVSSLQATGLHVGTACQGGRIRTRLVAFGRSETDTLHTISLSHIIEASMQYLHEFSDILRGAQFKEPAPAFLHLLAKAGFGVEKPLED
jgi:hypothetical protein